MRRVAALGLLLLAPSACTVSARSAEDDPRPNNTCQTDADCSNHHCSLGVCQEVNGTLESLLLSMTPPGGSGVPQLTFVSNVEDVPTSGGPLDLNFAGAISVRGSLSLPTGVSCYPSFIDENGNDLALRAPDGKSLPVDVTFSLRERLLGLPQQLYFDAAQTVDKLDPKTHAYTFTVKVPGGHFDLYVAPPPNQKQGCGIPPQLWRDYPVDGTTDLQLTAAPINDLSLTLHWPGGTSANDLVGWTADIIEPVGGNRISTVAKLGVPVGSSTLVEYSVPLRYSPATESAESKTAESDLLRLQPPAMLQAPTIYLDLSALRLFDPKQLDVTGFTKFPAAVQVHAQLSRLDTGKAVGGSLVLVSSQISGVDSGVFASYQVSLEVADDGLVDLTLPPGTYNVQGTPRMDSGSSSDSTEALGALTTVWDIAPAPSEQFGKTLELPVVAQLSGQSEVPGAQVQAIPVPDAVSPFEEAFGGKPQDDPNDPGVFRPRAATALVDRSGKFVVRADPGRFNVSLRGPESLGFAWFVRPAVTVTEKDQNLGVLTLPRPTLLSGACLVGSTNGTNARVPLATIRAYAYLDKDLAYTRDAAEATSVIQVAETRADDTGSFRLLVPPSLSHSR